MSQSKKSPDPAEQVLAQYEQDEKEFRNHWVWKDLQCSPDDFFKAVQKHVANLSIPSDVWKDAYQKAHESHRTRARERRIADNGENLKKMMSLIAV